MYIFCILLFANIPEHCHNIYIFCVQSNVCLKQTIVSLRKEIKLGGQTFRSNKAISGILRLYIQHHQSTQHDFLLWRNLVSLSCTVCRVY